MDSDMTPQEYKELMRVVRETRDLAVGNRACIDQIASQTGDLHEVLYKDGFLARIARIEQLVASERERVDLKFDAQGQVSGIRIASVEERSIDWKWIGMLLLQALLLAGVAGVGIGN